MTNEEAISEIKAILEEATETEDAVCYVTSVDAESLNLAIEALSRSEFPNSSDMISRQAAIDAIKTSRYLVDAMEKIIRLPSAQPNTQPTCNQLATVAKDICVPCKNSISRQAAIDTIANCTNCGDEKTLRAYVQKHNLDNGWTGGVLEAIDAIEDLPSAQSDIIRCNACKHWTQTTGNMPGFGLGDCDYLNAKLVSCNGFCYWAERRTDESD